MPNYFRIFVYGTVKDVAENVGGKKEGKIEKKMKANVKEKPI